MSEDTWQIYEVSCLQGRLTGDHQEDTSQAKSASTLALLTIVQNLTPKCAF